jgi:hypothetical protein
MTGVIVGGWEYVVAAYMITGATLAVYGLSIASRYRNEMKRRDRAREGES